MRKKADMLRQVLSLDKRRASNDLALMVGRFGIKWALEVMAEIFDEIAKDTDYTCCNNEAATLRARLLRQVGQMFGDDEEPVRDEEGRCLKCGAPPNFHSDPCDCS